MLTLAVFYIPFALTAVVVLTLMILHIGALAGDCPVTRARARAVSTSVATGFAAIGTGGVIIIGAALPILGEAPVVALMLTLGFAALCLGLGFTHAMGTLRAALTSLQGATLPKPEAA